MFFRNCALILLPLSLLCHDTLVAQNPSTQVSDSLASKHVGEMTTVVGYVVSVRTTRSGTTFLNLGHPYPNQSFTGVIFRSNAAQFPNPNQWQGQRVLVTGRIRLYQGKPEIILENATQISVAPR